MIVCKLQGGLGNQMFQYAIAESLALNKKTKLYFDLSFYEESIHPEITKRAYQLDLFKISINKAPAWLINLYSPHKVHSKWKRLLYRTIYKILNITYCNDEGTSLVAADLFKLKNNNIFLNGFWQNNAPFKFYNRDVSHKFLLEKPTSQKNIELFEQINKLNSVAIHVRRGDYVSNVKSFDFHGICEVTYYKNAIEQLNAKLDNPTYFIFSDDVQWVRDNFNFISNYTLVSDNAEQNNFEDFRLMRFCKHQIIANSTFSWWAAWLNDHEKKIVIAPKKWFNDEEANSKMILPSDWHRL